MRHTAVLALAAAGLLAGCAAAPGSGRACTEIGAPNGGSVRLDPARQADLPSAGPATVRVCVAARCETVEASWDQVRHGMGSWFVEVPSVSGPRPVEMSLVVTDAAGVRRVDARGEVAPKQVQPNGPGCPPTAWQARAVVSGSVLEPETSASDGTPAPL